MIIAKFFRSRLILIFTNLKNKLKTTFVKINPVRMVADMGKSNDRLLKFQEKFEISK
jgi:hypothetical protein